MLLPGALPTGGRVGKLPYPNIILRSSSCVAFVALILVNVLASRGALGPSNQVIAAKFNTPLTPAGWAFSIWGLIFLLQGLATVYQALPHGYAQEDGWKRAVVHAIGYGWQVGWAAECGWQLSFANASASSMWLQAALLVAGAAVFGATLHELHLLASSDKVRLGPQAWLLFIAPTSINAAWLSVASAVGLLMVPRAQGVSVHALLPYAVLAAAAVTALGLTVLWRRRDAAYGLTLVWALVAVYGAQHRHPAMKWSSLACIFLLGLFTMFALSKRPRRLAAEDVEEAERQRGRQAALLADEQAE